MIRDFVAACYRENLSSEIWPGALSIIVDERYVGLTGRGASAMTQIYLLTVSTYVDRLRDHIDSVSRSRAEALSWGAQVVLWVKVSTEQL